MVILQVPLKRDVIIELLNGKTFNDQTFRYVKQERMKIYFEVNGDQKQAAQTAKQVIKGCELGSALYYNVTYEE